MLGFLLFILAISSDLNSALIPYNLGEGCAICFTEFNEDPLQLPSRHAFHENCVTNRLRRHNTCPICRQNVPLHVNRFEDSIILFGIVLLPPFYATLLLPPQNLLPLMRIANTTSEFRGGIYIWRFRDKSSTQKVPGFFHHIFLKSS